jgi:ABC-type lipoprotein release transport system permease subunit
LRYLRSKRRSRLLSLISVLAVGGVGLGVAALIVVLAVLAGFETNFKEKLLGLQAHVTVYRPSSNIENWDRVVAAIERVPGVASVQPIATGQVMAASSDGATGVILMGLDPALAEKAGYFEPMNLSPHGLENLTARPMQTPYPIHEDIADSEWGRDGYVAPPSPGEALEILDYSDNPVDGGPGWEGGPAEDVGEALSGTAGQAPSPGEAPGEGPGEGPGKAPGEAAPDGGPAGGVSPGGGEAAGEPSPSAAGRPGPGSGPGNASPQGPAGYQAFPAASDADADAEADSAYRGLAEGAGAPAAPLAGGDGSYDGPEGEEGSGGRDGPEGLEEPPADAAVYVPPPPERGIILGSELSMLVGQGALGEVNVISPFGRVTPIGRRMPLSAIFRVAGVFRTNLFDYDSRVAFTTIKDAQEILGMDDTVSAVEIMCDDIYKAGEVRQLVLAALGPEFWGRDWMQMNMSLFSALKLEQAAMFVIMTLIILVAAFNIASTLVMMVTEKTRDIAILKAMGATGGQIRRIFTIQGLAVGGAGTLGGFVVGVAVCLLLARYEFIKLPPEVYLMSTLPVEMRPLQIAAILAVSMAISYLATLYPSSQAARLDPVEAIRYE